MAAAKLPFCQFGTLTSKPEPREITPSVKDRHILDNTLPVYLKHPAPAHISWTRAESTIYIGSRGLEIGAFFGCHCLPYIFTSM